MGDLIKAVSELFATALGALGFVGRTRQRAGIRQDLELLAALERFDDLGEDSAAHIFLAQHITIDVAEYAGVFDRKRKLWGSIVLAALVGTPLAYWTYRLNEHGFDWVSIFPGSFSFFMLVGGVGLLFESPKVRDDSESRMKVGLAQLRAELGRRETEPDLPDEVDSDLSR